MRRLGAIIGMLMTGLLVLHAQERVAGQQIVDTACRYMGRPYKYGATGPQRFDCSGLVVFSFAKNGIKLPRSSRDQARVGQRVQGGWDALQTGDLVFFGSSEVTHVGIYVGTNGSDRHEFIHCSSSKGVAIVPLEDSYWKPRYLYAKRLELIPSEQMVQPSNAEEEASDGSEGAPMKGQVGTAESCVSLPMTAVDNAPVYKTKRWKTRIRREDRKKIIWKK